MGAIAIPRLLRTPAACALACAWAMLAGSSRLEAVPPLVSGDVPTAEAGEFEIYAGVLYEKDAGVFARELPTAELVYGLTDHWEVTLEMPWLSESHVHGAGDLVVGTKYNFLPETKARPGMSLSLEVKLPTASSRRGLGSGAFDEDLLLRVQKTWGWFTILGNVGYTFLGEPDSGEPRRQGVWFASLVQGWEVTKTTTLFTEFYAEGSEEPGGRSRLAANLGFDQEIAKDFSIQGSIGRSLRDDRAGGPDLRMYLGIHWAFGAPWQRKEKPESGHGGLR